MKLQQKNKIKTGRLSWNGSLSFYLVCLMITLQTHVFAQQKTLLDASRYKSGSIVKNAFRQIVETPSKSTVKILHDGKQIALGTIVSSNGLILTKASELEDEIECELKNESLHDAKVVNIDHKNDLALLKISVKNLTPIHWKTNGDPKVGQWLATPGISNSPVSVGVVSVHRREIKGKPLLGVNIKEEEKGVLIVNVSPGSGADKAGIQEGDIVIGMGGKVVKTEAKLRESILDLHIGDKLHIKILRENEEKEFEAIIGVRPRNPRSRGAIQNRMGGSLSERRDDFPAVIQHDTVLRPQDCGGPVVNLLGEAIGINIARAGRTETYAIPADVVMKLLPKLKAKHFTTSTKASAKISSADSKGK